MSMSKSLTLDLLPDTYSIYRYPPEASLPFGPQVGSDLWAFVWTSEELSVVCADRVAGATHVEAGWRALKIRGPLDFSQVGILASIAGPLADAGVSIFTISTFDTDYILIKEDTLELAINELEKVGHQVLVGQT
jgi:uncharacterized protein